MDSRRGARVRLSFELSNDVLVFWASCICETLQLLSCGPEAGNPKNAYEGFLAVRLIYGLPCDMREGVRTHCITRLTKEGRVFGLKICWDGGIS
jgi:hypothetical protein